MLKNSKYYFAIILFVALFSCDENATPSPSNSIVPLQVGQVWINEMKSLDSSGNVLSSHFDTMEVIGTKIYKDEVWYKLNRFFMMANRSDGLYMNFSDGSEESSEIYQTIKYPVAVNDTFVMGTGFNKTNETGKTIDKVRPYFRVVSIKEPVTVPAGTFECCQYNMCILQDNKEIVVSSDYYRKGVGHIKTLRYSNGKVISSSELIKTYIK